MNTVLGIIGGLTTLATVFLALRISGLKGAAEKAKGDLQIQVGFRMDAEQVLMSAQREHNASEERWKAQMLALNADIVELEKDLRKVNVHGAARTRLTRLFGKAKNL